VPFLLSQLSHLENGRPNSLPDHRACRNTGTDLPVAHGFLSIVSDGCGRTGERTGNAPSGAAEVIKMRRTHTERMMKKEFRMNLINRLRDLTPRERARLVEELVTQKYRIPFSKQESISKTTIYRWLREFRESANAGTALMGKVRSDKGLFRSLNVAILYVIVENEGAVINREPTTEKLPVTAFEIDPETKLINKCPNNIEPLHSGVTKSQTVAHFKLEDCCNCELCNQCPVKLQKKGAVVRINLNSISAAEVRAEIKEEQKENTSMRAAIEGTNSTLKRSQGLGKLRVRGGVKCQIVVGFKVIAQNIKRVCNVLLGKMPKPRKSF
jgi:transposase-like protein